MKHLCEVGPAAAPYDIMHLANLTLMLSHCYGSCLLDCYHLMGKELMTSCFLEPKWPQLVARWSKQEHDRRGGVLPAGRWKQSRSILTGLCCMTLRWSATRCPSPSPSWSVSSQLGTASGGSATLQNGFGIHCFYGLGGAQHDVPEGALGAVVGTAEHEIQQFVLFDREPFSEER